MGAASGANRGADPMRPRRREGGFEHRPRSADRALEQRLAAELAEACRRDRNQRQPLPTEGVEHGGDRTDDIDGHRAPQVRGHPDGTDQARGRQEESVRRGNDRGISLVSPATTRSSDAARYTRQSALALVRGRRAGGSAETSGDTSTPCPLCQEARHHGVESARRRVNVGLSVDRRPVMNEPASRERGAHTTGQTNRPRPHDEPGPTPGGQAKSPLPTCWMYSFNASLNLPASERWITTNCLRGSRW